MQNCGFKSAFGYFSSEQIGTLQQQKKKCPKWSGFLKNVRQKQNNFCWYAFDKRRMLHYD